MTWINQILNCFSISPIVLNITYKVLTKEVTTYNVGSKETNDIFLWGYLIIMIAKPEFFPFLWENYENRCIYLTTRMCLCYKKIADTT